MRKLTFSIFLLVLFQITIYSLKVSKKEIINPKKSYSVGEIVKAKVLLQKNENEKIVNIKDKIKKDIEILNSTLKKKKNKIIIRKKYQIFTLKAEKLPDIEVEYQKNKDRNKILVEGIDIKIKNLTDKKLKLNKIEGPKKDIETDYSIWPLLIFIVLFILAGYGGYLLYRKLKNRKIENKTKPIYLKKDIDPMEYLINNWDKINLDNYINSNNHKELYFKITEIIRKFLSLYYRKNFIDMTVSEFKKNFHKDIDKKLKKELFEFLTFADTVKFGKHKPDKKDIKYIESFMNKMIKYYKKINSEEEKNEENDK